MIRIATVGSGFITALFAESVSRTAGIRIEAVHSRDAGRAAELAARIGAERWITSFEELLASPDIDALYVASPNGLHARQTLAALEAGKHVLVEKPATPTAAEWAALLGASERAGLVLLEGIRNEYDPGVAAMRGLLPELGTIRHVSFRYESRSSRYDQVLAGERVNIFDPKMAGGALLDLGVYCVHPLISLFGLPKRVSASTVTISSGADGAGTALVEYPGFIADLHYSKITTSFLPSEIQGEEGTLVIDHIASPRLLTLHRPDGASEEHVLHEPQHTLDGAVERFVRLVSSAASAHRDQELTNRTLRVMDAIRASWDNTTATIPEIARHKS